MTHKRSGKKAIVLENKSVRVYFHKQIEGSYRVVNVRELCKLKVLDSNTISVNGKIVDIGAVYALKGAGTFDQRFYTFACSSGRNLPPRISSGVLSEAKKEVKEVEHKAEPVAEPVAKSIVKVEPLPTRTEVVKVVETAPNPWKRKD